MLDIESISNQVKGLKILDVSAVFTDDTNMARLSTLDYTEVPSFEKGILDRYDHLREYVEKGNFLFSKRAFDGFTRKLVIVERYYKRQEKQIARCLRNVERVRGCRVPSLLNRDDIRNSRDGNSHFIRRLRELKKFILRKSIDRTKFFGDYEDYLRDVTEVSTNSSYKGPRLYEEEKTFIAESLAFSNGENVSLVTANRSVLDFLLYADEERMERFHNASVIFIGRK